MTSLRTWKAGDFSSSTAAQLALPKTVRFFTLSESDYSFILSQVAVFGVIAGVASLQTRIARRKSRESMVALSGTHTRLVFLTLLAGGFGIRMVIGVCVFVMTAFFSVSLIPFTLAVLNSVPSLMILTAYSLTASFFADIGSRKGTAAVPFLTPVLIGVNALMYFLFFVVASVTKVHRAHREFRLYSALLMGITHTLLAGLWLHFGFKLIGKLQGRRTAGSAADNSYAFAAAVSEQERLPASNHSKKYQTPFSEDTHQAPAESTHISGVSPEGGDWESPVASLSALPTTVRDSSAFVSVSAGVSSSASSSRSSGNLVGGLISRLWCMSLLCPPLFLLNGAVEIFLASQLYQNIDASKDALARNDLFFTFTGENVALFVAQVLPPIVILLAFWPTELSITRRHPLLLALWPLSSRMTTEDPRRRLRAFFGRDSRCYPLLHPPS